MVAVDFIQDLGVVVLLAAAAGWLCQRIGLPVVLGYLTVGILVGPHTPSLPLVTNTERIHALAQLGLVFLIFSIGQGLRLQRLRRFGLPLILATVLIAILILNVCRLIGASLGWPSEHGLVLAGMLMVSSTAVIGKSLRETNTLHSAYGQTALTVTALDDLVAVVMLTVLTSLAQAGATEGAVVLGTVVRLNAVMISLVVVAALAVPPLLRTLGRRALPEVQSLFVVGLLLLMALLPARAGFSAALGAFLLGVIVSSTGLGPQIERALPGLCDVFGAVFFVAMGMLFDPGMFVEVWPWALGVFVLAFLGRLAAASFALLLVGHSAADALKAGVALTAIGEFSLIIALVAVDAGLAPASFYPIAVGLCLVTAATAPFLIRHAPEMGDWLERNQPESLRLWIGCYHDRLKELRQRQRSHRVWRIIGPRVTQIVLQLLLISGLLLLAAPCYDLAERWLGRDWPARNALPVLFWLAFGALLLAPLAALWRQIGAASMLCAEAATQSGSGRAAVRPFFKALAQGATVGAAGLWLATLLPLKLLGPWQLAIVAVILAALVAAGWRRLIRWHSRFELELRAQLADSPFRCGGIEGANGRQAPEAQLRAGDLVIRAQTRAVKRSIRDLALREQFGCTLVGVERQGICLRNPAADTELFPNDRILLLGQEQDIRRAEAWLNVTDPSPIPPEGRPDFRDMVLRPLAVPPASRHLGKPLGDLELATRWGVQVVSIGRNHGTLVGPGRSETLQAGDMLLVLGSLDRIEELAFWLST